MRLRTSTTTADRNSVCSTWEIEVTRSIAERIYVRNYLCNASGRKTLLDFLNDITPDEMISLDPFALDDELESPEWLRRFIRGYWNKQTGRYIYTIPTHERLKRLLRFVRDSGLVSEVELRKHTKQLRKALVQASINGYDRYADQSLLAGTYRGAYFGEEGSDDHTCQTVTLIYQIKGEAYFRVRDVKFRFSIQPDEHESALERRISSQLWDSCEIFEGFAAFGTDFGALFGYEKDENFAADAHVNNFSFAQKGRRCVAYTRMSDFDQLDGTVFRLCNNRSRIDAATQLLKSATEWAII